PEEECQRTLLNELIRDNRVNHVCPADYSEDSEIDVVVKTIIDKIELDYRLSELEVAKSI
ncbi:MAG: haloacid dehalogenase-like hydrolase, partial [Alistipes sp.]|nr:haloacid dehalogenase-like hydrolase [Alistipes sp.]